MCTVVILHRPGHPWPLLLAANRDERLDRAWDPPAAHWPGHPGVVGGRDRSGGGSWMAMGARVVAAALNRPGSLGPAPGKRSRGVLPLIAASAPSAAAAVRHLVALDAGEWRPFNLVVADRDRAVFLRGLGHGHPEALGLPAGVHMVTAHDPDDPASPRIRRHLPHFRAAPAPDPATGDWAAWEALLADDSTGPDGIADALRVPPVEGFGTVSASLAALGADGSRSWRFCPGPAGTAPFRPVALPG
ncbi:NRDE family protein [Falsiroseomonas sp. CW058]|uniref:NRDE family protein n=1 Tax=Falsiroseomonas sp. CW058 TaxID=3388664 RepID=UPI003D319BA7